MKNPFSSLNLIAGSIAVAATMCLPSSSQAATFTYIVDPTQSHLTMSGGVFGLSYSGQNGASSLFDTLSGTIIGNLDPTGTQLTFSGGSAITAGLNSTPFFLPNVHPFPLTPVPYGPGGFSPPTPYGINNYGVHAAGLVSGYGACLVNGSYQGLVLDLPTGTAQNGLASSANLYFTAGAIESIGSAAGGTIPLGDISSMIGNNGNNVSPSLVSMVLSAGITGTYSTMTLPVQFQTTGGNGRTENWVGQIVAIAQIPEPSVVALALVGLGLYAARARARRV